MVVENKTPAFSHEVESVVNKLSNPADKVRITKGLTTLFKTGSRQDISSEDFHIDIYRDDVVEAMTSVRVPIHPIETALDRLREEIVAHYAAMEEKYGPLYYLPVMLTGLINSEEILRLAEPIEDKSYRLLGTPEGEFELSTDMDQEVWLKPVVDLRYIAPSTSYAPNQLQCLITASTGTGHVIEMFPFTGDHVEAIIGGLRTILSRLK